MEVLDSRSHPDSRATHGNLQVYVHKSSEEYCNFYLDVNKIAAAWLIFKIGWGRCEEIR
jgi:hypothetical protein